MGMATIRELPWVLEYFLSHRSFLPWTGVRP